MAQALVCALVLALPLVLALMLALVCANGPHTRNFHIRLNQSCTGVKSRCWCVWDCPRSDTNPTSVPAWNGRPWRTLCHPNGTHEHWQHVVAACCER